MLNAIRFSVRNALNPEAAATAPMPEVAIKDSLPTTELLPPVAQANDKAMQMLTAANAAIIKAETTAKDDIFNAAAECDSFAVWQATVNTWRKVHKADLTKTANMYISTVTMAWKERETRAASVRKAYADLRALGADDATFGKFVGVKERAEDTESFLDPRSTVYKEAADYWRDVRLVGEAEKTADKARKANEAAKVRREAVAGNPAAAVNGTTRQTGTLDEEMQNALNGVIRAVHGKAADFDTAGFREYVLHCLRECEADIAMAKVSDFTDAAPSEQPNG